MSCSPGTKSCSASRTLAHLEQFGSVSSAWEIVVACTLVAYGSYRIDFCGYVGPCAFVLFYNTDLPSFGMLDFVTKQTSNSDKLTSLCTWSTSNCLSIAKSFISIRELPIKKCSLIMDFFQKGLTPPPRLLELLGHFFVG